MRIQVNRYQKTGSYVRRQLQYFRFITVIVLIIATSASAFAVQASPALQATTPKHAKAADMIAPKQAFNVAGGNAQTHQMTGLDMTEIGGPLVTEFGRLATKIQQGVTLPPPRTQSRVLNMLPASTSIFFSFANYGDSLYQANQIFNQELQESTVLNEWWQSKAGIAGMMMQGVIEQVHQFTGYLGDEIVVAANVKAKGPSFLVLAEVKKPGLKAFLQGLLDQYGGKNAPIQLLTPQQLIGATAPVKKKDQIVALVRPDLLVVANDIATLRSFNAQLNRGPSGFSSSAFGQKLAQTYQGGVGMVLGADLQPLLALRPQGQPQSEAMLQQSGFGDVKYLIMSGRLSGGASSSSMELTFNGARHGIAGWLGAPAQLGALDFVPTDSITAGAVALKSPALIFDDVKAIANAANPMATMGLAQVESQYHINLRDDLFSKLGGQIGFAMKGPLGQTPIWNLIVQVSDSDRLQRMVWQLLAAVSGASEDGKGIQLTEKTVDGVKYASVGFSGGGKHEEVDYAFADGYLVAANSAVALKESIDAHRNGTSLAKSSEFRKLLPPGYSGGASVVVAQNTGLLLGSMAQQMPAEMGQLFKSLSGESKLSVMTAYGEPNSIRSISNNQTFDMAIPLVVAAVAIPNIMRSKTAANEAAAAATVRTLNTAEVTYQVTYNKFAPDIATLGSGPGGTCDTPTEKRSCLIDNKLARAECSSGAWCTQGVYQYSIVTDCQSSPCLDYLVVATPTNSGAGNKSFCSTSEAVIRSKSGPPLMEPVSAEECKSWEPL